MSGFIATAPIPPLAPAGDVIANDGWFPSLSMSATRNAMRLDGTITDQRLRDALVAAMLDVNRQLARYRARAEEMGHTSLGAAAEGATLDGVPRTVLLYQRAVMCLAHASLSEHYRDFDAAGSARQVEDLPLIDEQRRNARWAVRELLGETHVLVELV